MIILTSWLQRELEYKDAVCRGDGSGGEINFLLLIVTCCSVHFICWLDFGPVHTHWMSFHFIGQCTTYTVCVEILSWTFFSIRLMLSWGKRFWRLGKRVENDFFENPGLVVRCPLKDRLARAKNLWDRSRATHCRWDKEKNISNSILNVLIFRTKLISSALR